MVNYLWNKKKDFKKLAMAKNIEFFVKINFPFRGSAIAKIIGANAVKFNNKFEERVTMYVYEEMIDGKKLTEIINEQHENVKYLPGHKLPANIVSIKKIIIFCAFN